MVLKSIITKYLLIAVLPSALAITLYITLFENHNNRDDKKAIKELQKDNKRLSLENDSIRLQLETKEKDVKKYESIIAELLAQKEVLTDKVDSVSGLIKQNNKGYEKAAHHSDNYGTNDIQRYFSNIK